MTPGQPSHCRAGGWKLARIQLVHGSCEMSQAQLASIICTVPEAQWASVDLGGWLTRCRMRSSCNKTLQTKLLAWASGHDMPCPIPQRSCSLCMLMDMPRLD